MITLQGHLDFLVLFKFSPEANPFLHQSPPLLIAPYADFHSSALLSIPPPPPAHPAHLLCLSSASHFVDSHSRAEKQMFPLQSQPIPPPLRFFPESGPGGSVLHLNCFVSDVPTDAHFIPEHSKNTCGVQRAHPTPPSHGPMLPGRLHIVPASQAFS